MALWLRKVHRCNPGDRWSILRLSWKRVTDGPPRKWRLRFSVESHDSRCSSGAISKLF
jgi:hypothetical protein